MYAGDAEGLECESLQVCGYTFREFRAQYINSSLMMLCQHAGKKYQGTARISTLEAHEYMPFN
jgi:hypothetical protein